MEKLSEEQKETRRKTLHEKKRRRRERVLEEKAKQSQPGAPQQQLPLMGPCPKGRLLTSPRVLRLFPLREVTEERGYGPRARRRHPKGRSTPCPQGPQPKQAPSKTVFKRKEGALPVSMLRTFGDTSLAH